MKCSTQAGTSLFPIEEAAIDITWVLSQLKSALNAGDKGKKRELEIGPGDSDNLPSAKRYLILSQYLTEDKY